MLEIAWCGNGNSARLAESSAQGCLSVSELFRVFNDQKSRIKRLTASSCWPKQGTTNHLYIVLGTSSFVRNGSSVPANEDEIRV
jgi:hypothetical protein